MCGITGIIAYKKQGKQYLKSVDNSVQSLKKRGPDSDGTYFHQNIGLGHTRLSILDTSEAANQPFSDDSERYVMVFNGEIYNFKSIRQSLQNLGYTFHTSGDTEVLLTAYKAWGKKVLDRLNGFFALAIYDKLEETLFVARDRMGIKPLLFYQDENAFIFASEMKAILAYGIPKTLDETALFTYLQLNYIPQPHSIFKEVQKLEVGHYLWIDAKEKAGTTAPIKPIPYYQIPYNATIKTPLSYEQAQAKTLELMEDSVRLRMVSDVPLGVFLSGGIDSSVITALASKHTQQLQTFSIGFKDEPLFDETKYAQLVAKRYNTKHTVFSLTNNDLYEHLHAVLDYIDEPFADSSALPVHILSEHTKRHVTVALSGDGGDELFAGYNKHKAEFRARQAGMLSHLVKIGTPIWKYLPQSRDSKVGNVFRQLNRFADGLSLGHRERYWQWASLLSPQAAQQLLRTNIEAHDFQTRKKHLTQAIREEGNLNEVLYADMNMVLVGDMLAKVDSMSMANGLEVRTPFLDHRLVNFAFSLPVSYKIDQHLTKKIIQDAFRSLLPPALYNRPKHGFDVPLLKWFKTELRSMIEEDLLSRDFVEAQGIFNYTAIQQLLQQLYSNNPKEAVNTVWALIVFQHWWRKYLTI